MSKLIDLYSVSADLKLGRDLITRVPEADQIRQRTEVETILSRLRSQPGVILADEVGMGKTYVALSVAFSIATQSPRGPVVVMVPANLVGKWEKDLKTFCELYVPSRTPVMRNGTAGPKGLKHLRYGVARHSVDFLKFLDDDRSQRCHLIFLASGAMSRSQTDKWVRLALISECLRQYGRGRAERLIQVKEQIHRFLGRLLGATGEERATARKEAIWQKLLKTDCIEWMHIYNQSVPNEKDHLHDNPVPKAIARAIERIDLRPIAEALKEMPVRARGGDDRISERIAVARKALRGVEDELWKQLLAVSSWKSPLLVMDEAHHLKNPGTSLARTLQSPELSDDLRTGDGAMAKAFDRMLFLTATPFQLGHSELVQVLRRFGDVRWDSKSLGVQAEFVGKLKELEERLNDSQRSAIGLHRIWSRVDPAEAKDSPDSWWSEVLCASRDSLTNTSRAFVEAFESAKKQRVLAEGALRPWIVRYNKFDFWPGTEIPRRSRRVGDSIAGRDNSVGGLEIPSGQLLPFFLAARSAVEPGKDLLGEALSSSYEAFRDTRKARTAIKDEQEEQETAVDPSFAQWYLSEFDEAIREVGGSVHPKVSATVRAAADLWESGEKVLVFAYYRYTCRALRIHISREIEKRITGNAERRLREAGVSIEDTTVDRIIENIQRRFFDQLNTPGRLAVDRALSELLLSRKAELGKEKTPADENEKVVDVMRRFLRASTTLVCCFPLERYNEMTPEDAVASALNCKDRSGVTWRQKFETFIDFAVSQCSPSERQDYLDAALKVQTGEIRVLEGENDIGADSKTAAQTLPNIQVVTGETKHDARSRLMLAFNTPFFPDILVCSEVMGEGVDLQRFCRFVIHHDLAWNPSQIEQRTGRIDRLGCKAEGRNPIVTYLPFIAGAADERQFKVMSDREQWFRVVMGQDAVNKLIRPGGAEGIRLPESIASELTFRLAI